MKTNASIDLNLLPLHLPPGIRLQRLPDGGAVGRFLNVELGSVFQLRGRLLAAVGEDHGRYSAGYSSGWRFVPHRLCSKRRRDGLV